MSYRSDKQKLTNTQIHTHTHTDTGDDNTRRPKGPRVKMSCMPQLLKITGCLILTIEHSHNYSI